MPGRDHIPPLRFHALTPVYDLACRLLGLGESLRRFEIGLLEKVAPRRILEVGCGTGVLLRLVGSRFPGATLRAIDPDGAALASARQRLDGARIEAELVLGRAESLPFPDGSFDLVLSSLMLHHLDTETKVKALAEWRRVLEPGGLLLLVDFGVPRSLLTKVLLWPLRFRILEEQADNFRGRVPEMLRAAGFAFEEAGVYGSVVVAYRARPAA
jgi:demethylmenaquinone methyltransferase/2-methoxy-6-polyprenyl-1,4-benzoquinol methylase/phosphoethanolamine N-methyltransferase